MIPFCGRPFLQYTLESLRGLVSRAIIVINYKGEQIKSHFGSRWRELPLHYVRQPTLCGTGDALLVARNLVREPFLVILGDVYASRELLQALMEHESPNVLALTKVNDPENHVGVDFEDGRVTGLWTLNPWVDRGLWKFSPAIFESLVQAERRDSILRALRGVEAMLKAGERVEVLLSDEPWIQLGDHAARQSVLDACHFFLRQQGRVYYGEGKNCQIYGSSLEVTAENCHIVNSVVFGRGKLLNSRVESSVVLCRWNTENVDLKGEIIIL